MRFLKEKAIYEPHPQRIYALPPFPKGEGKQCATAPHVQQIKFYFANGPSGTPVPTFPIGGDLQFWEMCVSMILRHILIFARIGAFCIR